MSVIETSKSAGTTKQKTVSTSAVQLDADATHQAMIGVRIKNTHASNDLFVGFDNSVTTSNGYKLAAGEEVHVPIDSAASIWLIASAASTVASYMAV